MWNIDDGFVWVIVVDFVIIVSIFLFSCVCDFIV